MRALSAIVLAVCSTWFFSQPALAEKRVALVMGNSAYRNVVRLANPANDSEAMSAIFRKAGFDVVELKRNLGVSEMRRTLRDFADSVRDADVAIVYYAGHGIEINGNNYLIPVDAVLERDIDAFDEAIPLDRILTVIEPARQLRLVILDACRDNPFNKSMKRTIGSRAIGRGLAKVEPESPNTLIAFAAKAGSTASDGDSANSPFTAALVKFLPRPGLDLRKAFGYARDDVLKATNNKQEPFIYGSLGGADVALVPAIAAPPAKSDASAGERRDYELTERVGTREAWDSFLAIYPNGFYATLAQAQRNKLVADEARAAVAEKKRVAEEAKIAETAAEKAAEAERARAAAAQAKAEQDAKLAAEKAKADEQNASNDKPMGQLAALTPPDQASAATAKSDQPTANNLSRLLQSELRRVGCGTAAIDDNWSATAQKALGLFNKNAGTKFDVKVASVDALEVLRTKLIRVCPLICEHGFKADGNQCTRIVCKAGYEVGDDNTCEEVESRKAAKKRPATIASPVAERFGAPKESRGSVPSGLPACSAYCTQASVVGRSGDFAVSRCLAMGPCDHSR